MDEAIRKELRKKYNNKIVRAGQNGFENFSNFYAWAMENEYFSGATLRRCDTGQPYSPDNCYFSKPVDQPTFYGVEREDFIRRWNRSVNPFRKAAGLEPFAEEVADNKKALPE